MKEFFTFFFAIVYTINGHGLLSFPSSKNGGTLSTPHESATVHFALGSYGIIDKAFFDNDHSKTPWTKNGHFDYELARDLIPSYPQTLHPCGCNAGNIAQCAGVVDASGFGETTLGGTVIPPDWAKGSEQETAWNAWVNHSGGHIYMLCKKTNFDFCRDDILPDNPALATQAEKDAYLQCVWDCFESNTLEWAPGLQKLQFQDDQCTYATMNPSTKVGKNGHVWRYTPIVDSLQVSNGGEGVCMWDSVSEFSNQEAEDEFTASFGTTDVCDWGPDAHAPKNWHVMDKVIVPMDLEEGEYLLSWRWDSYMADQMWTNCADVKIIAPQTSDVTPSMQSDCTAMPSQIHVPTPLPAPVSSLPTSTPVVSPPTSGLFCPPGYTGLLPYDNCTQYFHCNTGVVDGDLESCAAGTLFSFDLQYCDWEENVTCETTPTLMPIVLPSTPTTTPVTSTPTTTPVSSTPTLSLSCPSGYTGLRPYDSCTKYYHCLNGVLLGGLSDCYEGTLFDIDYQYCNWADQVTCETPMGCYSNNYRDCNHPDFQSENNSCNTIWLPDGGRNSCIPLWGECTNQNDNCCDPASCYVNDVVGSYAQCVPSCIECTDEEDPILIQYGYECEEADRYLVRRCNTHPVWSTEKYCQLSCYNLGLGYDGELCCNGTT